MLDNTTVSVNLLTEKYDVKGCRSNNGKILQPPHWSCIGNPYYLINPDDDFERHNVIKDYKKYFLSRIKKDIAFREYVLSLKGKRIGCFCKPKPCHIDIVVEYINETYK